MICFMKRSLAILTFIASLILPGTAFAAHPESDPGSKTGPTTVSDAAPRILELINRERADAGLAGLKFDEEATEIAVRWTREMALAGRLSHNRAYLNRESMERLNATTVGENVAFADSVDEIHSLFMESPPHRANILNPDFQLVGVGAVRSSGGELYLTEDFLTRRAAPPSRGEQAAPPRPAKPPAPFRTRPAPPAQGSPRPAATASRPVAAPARATKTPLPSIPAAPPTPAAPAPAPSPETLPPVAPAEPIPAEPLPTPAAPGSDDSVQMSQSDRPAVEGPTLEGTAPRPRQSNSADDLLKGLPVLALYSLRRFGRQR